MVGIYKITNPEGKIYIGLSKNIELRWKSYRSKSGMNKTSTFKLSLDKYKHEDHIFEVIEEVINDNKLLRERERYWINYYQSNINGLNDNRGGCGPGSHTSQSKQKISSALKNKPKPADFGKKRVKWQSTDEFKEKIKNAPRCPILMYDLDGKYITEFPNQQQAAEFVGVRKEMIWNVLNNFINRSGTPITQVRGYKFKYKNKMS
jgi:group I intron endonuclease